MPRWPNAAAARMRAARWSCRVMVAPQRSRPSRSSNTFCSTASSTPRLREDAALNRLHRATTRRPAPPWIAALAFDHRAPLEQLAAELNTPLSRITQFKHLVARRHSGASFRADGLGAAHGLILDDRYGADLLPELDEAGWWIARPVEEPGLTPAALRAWSQRAGNVARVAGAPYRQMPGVI